MLGLAVFDVMKKRTMKNKWIFTAVLAAQIILILIVGVIVLNKGDQLLLVGTTMEQFRELELKKGSYELRFSYQSSTNDNIATVISETDPWGIQADTMHFYTWKTGDYLDFRAKRDIHDGELANNLPGECIFKTIELYETAAAARRSWVELIFGLALADACFLWISKVFLRSDDKHGVLMRALVLTASVFLSSIIILKNYVYFGPDLAFHLTRIQGIADGLLSGQFPVRINTYWLDGAGVAVPVFYGDFLLYFPALLYMCGFTLQEALKIYVVTISFLTAIVGYKAFCLYFRRPWTAVACSVFYVLSLYRIMNFLRRGAIGEYSAMCFLPLAICGLLLLLENDERQNRGALMLAIGTACTLATHNITTLLLISDLALIFLLKLITDPRKILSGKTVAALGKAVGIAMGLSAFFWMPMLSYLRTGDMGVSNSLLSGGLDDTVFADQSLGLGGLLTFGGHILEEEILGILVVAVVGLYVLARLFLLAKFRGQRSASTTGTMILVIFVIQLILSSKLTPWDLLNENTPLLNKWISVLQFPFRYLSMETVLATFLLGFLMEGLYELPTIQKKKGLCSIGLIVLMIICGLNAFGYQKKMDEVGSRYRFYGHNAFSLYWGWNLEYSFELPDRFYLPSGTEIEYYRGAFANMKGLNPGLEFTGEIRRSGVKLEMHCKNASDQPAVLLVPYVMYPGYQAEDQASGIKLPVIKGPAAMVQVELPGGYEGDLRVAFCEPKMWRVAEAISLLTVLALGAYGIRKRKT